MYKKHILLSTGVSLHCRHEKIYEREHVTETLGRDDFIFLFQIVWGIHPMSSVNLINKCYGMFGMNFPFGVKFSIQSKPIQLKLFVHFFFTFVRICFDHNPYGTFGPGNFNKNLELELS
jgi:hypothetical protein